MEGTLKPPYGEAHVDAMNGLSKTTEGMEKWAAKNRARFDAEVT